MTCAAITAAQIAKLSRAAAGCDLVLTLPGSPLCL